MADHLELHFWLFLITAYLYLKHKRIRRWCVRPINQNRKETGHYRTLFLQMKANDPEQFFVYTRMNVRAFEKLLGMLRRNLLKRSNREPLNPEERLSMTLKYLSQGGTMQSLAWEYRVGKSTVSCVIFEVCNIIWRILSPIYLKEQTVEDWTKISQEFYEKWNFPNCLGAIDGKHISIQCPRQGGTQFFNHKKSHSIILMAACDARYKFTMCDIGGYGSQGDRAIFGKSVFGNAIIENLLHFPPWKVLPGSAIKLPPVFVADSAFPLLKNIMRPYPGRLLPENQKVFNYRLSRARRTIESTFGVLAARWRIFRAPIVAEPNTVDAIVKAAVCLHNYVMSINKPQYCPEDYVDRETANGDIIEGRWQQEINDNCALRNTGRLGSNNAQFGAKDIRKQLTDYFISSAGEVSWQYDHVWAGS